MRRNRWMIWTLVVGFFFVVNPNAYSQDDIFIKTSPSFTAQGGDGDNAVPDEIIVKFKSGIAQEAIDKINAKFKMNHRYKSPLNGFSCLLVPKGKTVSQMVALYKQNPNVEYAEPNYMAHAFFSPNDPYFKYQWNMDNPATGNIHMTKAWDLTTGTPSVIVAVVDTGAAYENYTQRTFGSTKRYYLAPDLAATKFVAGYDFINNDTHPNDDEGHGTHVTGTIAQSTHNKLGVTGIAFNTAIMPVKVLDKNGSGSYSAVADGIRYAADHGAKVINLSLGGSQPSITLENACAYAYNKGVTLVCAAGNDGASAISYPAAYDRYCIAVGATRFDEARSKYSNYGNSLDVVAPGGDISVDQNKDGYGDGILQQTFGNKNTSNFGYYFYQGTSMATPHVSGIAALALAKSVATTPDQVREILQTTAKDLGTTGWDQNFGWGLVNAFAALNYQKIPNAAPTAVITPLAKSTEKTATKFDGAQSFDVNGDSLTYSWDFGDGQTASGPRPAHSYKEGGEYTVSLIVNDGKTNSQSTTSTIVVDEVNDAPVADPDGPYLGRVGQAIAFEGESSFDLEGAIKEYQWNFGDGTIANGKNQKHIYSRPGNFKVTLTVTDQGNLSDTKTTFALIAR